METARTTASLIRFFCTGCGQKFSCEPDAAGHVFDCPVCTEQITAPAHTAASEPDFDRTRIPGATLKFRCHCCGQKLSIPIEFSGTTYDCPSCASQGSVPILNGAPIPADGPITSEEREHARKFFCASCGQHLLADAELAGEQIACPICSDFTPIPHPPEAPRGAAISGPPAKPAPDTTPLKTRDSQPKSEDHTVNDPPRPKRPSAPRATKSRIRGLHNHHRIGQNPDAASGLSTPDSPDPDPKPSSPTGRKSLKRKPPKPRKARGTAPARSVNGAPPKTASANGHPKRTPHPAADASPAKPHNGAATNGSKPNGSAAGPDRTNGHRPKAASPPEASPTRKPKSALLGSLAKLGFEITPISTTAKRASDAMEDE